MASSDAIVIGEGWISEHYFTTDANSQSFKARVLERRKQWDEAKTEGYPSTRSRFTEARAALEADLALLPAESADDERARDLYARLVTALGFTSSGLTLERSGPLQSVTTPGLSESAPLVLIEAKPVDEIETLLQRDAQTLLSPYVLDEKTELTSVARLLTTLMVAADGPRFALVIAGRWLLLAERERWPEGRYLAVNLQLVTERNDDKRGGEIDRALTCVDAQSLLPTIDTGEIWWSGVLDESVRHTVGVSQDLRDGVRLSIEIIANEVVNRRAAADCEPLPKEEAQPLAIQSLRFLYRILFLLYAEASPELGVLPIGAPEYEQGYSLDRLRDLALVELADPRAKAGRHIYESLGTLFRLVEEGHRPVGPDPLGTAENGGRSPAEGMPFHALRADLFAPAATAHIDAVGLGNEALQAVLQHLLLSRESRGKDRGFVSYAELGINQLGAVYEGLMSYTGFFAEDDLYEVAKSGDPSKGSWVVPVARAEGISESDFVKERDPATDEWKPVIHERGSFVFRLAGRERQQSASYYTPEVLTRFVVSQALAELLDQDDTVTSAAEILELTVCEPALGSGAFAIEAVRQLAELYLTRRQRELGQKIDPDEYQRELQRVKASIALHQVYGVDLNATAVELAEISLWLDTMVEGLAAPWFGLHLRRGNSLIGARRAVFTRGEVNHKAHLAATPRDIPMAELADNLTEGRVSQATAGTIHHFLLPSDGWGSSAEAKEAKELAPERVAQLKDWRRAIRATPTRRQVDQLVELGYRVEVLWQLALRRMQLAEQQVRRPIAVWGTEDHRAGGAVSRETIEASLADANGAFRRLRRVMDAWTALWFWPLADTGVPGAALPSLDQWIQAAQQLLGRHVEASAAAQRHGQVSLTSAADWEELGTAEEYDLALASAADVDDVLEAHPWLRVCERIAAQQGFFHWELDFAATFARGGFDLQVGNPPWVRPDWDEAAALGEFDVRWAVGGKLEQAAALRLREETLSRPGARESYIEGLGDLVAARELVATPARFPLLGGLRPDLYRCFMEQTWRNRSNSGVVTLIHPETHFTDEKAGRLRSEAYVRLRRHWQFINELHLYTEIHNLVSYGVHVYGSPGEVNFQMATSLYRPDTVERSFRHDGSGPEPGLKDDRGHWDLRPHRDRIIRVTREGLLAWHSMLEAPTTPLLHTRMLYALNATTERVLARGAQMARVSSLGLSYSGGWDEGADYKKGRFAVSWGTPRDWESVVLQGPHLSVLTPIYQSPRATMKSNRDWAEVDLEQLSDAAVPTVRYRPAGDRAVYDASYTRWGSEKSLPARDRYRVAWRAMAANTGVRTLQPALIPPGAAHVDGVYSAGFVEQDLRLLTKVTAVMSSLIADLFVRSVPKSAIREWSIGRLPVPLDERLDSLLELRVCRLSALTSAYGAFWQEVWRDEFVADTWTGGLQYPGRPALGDVSYVWTGATPLRRASDRRQAQLEIDALIALALGVSADDLCAIYATQFPVLRAYDERGHLYDAQGRLVPYEIATTWRRKGADLSLEERTSRNEAGNRYVYELPFANLDRQADMRQAYTHFERILQERS